MAATALALKSISRTAVLTKPTPVAMDNVNGNSIPNGGSTFLEVTAPAGGGTVTVALVDKPDGQVPAPKSYTFAASQVGLIGPFPVNYYGATLTVTPSATGFTCIPYSL